MNQSMTIAVNLTKDVLEVPVGDAKGRIVERSRLSRTQFLRFFHNRPPGAVVRLELCLDECALMLARYSRSLPVCGDGNAACPSWSTRPHLFG